MKEGGEGEAPHTLLPTCCILRKTGFQVGFNSSFMTSVLQMGIEIPDSAVLDITKKGSCNNDKNMQPG